MSEMIRVLLVEPHKHPRLVEVEHTLENLQRLVGGYIAASYPWDDHVSLVYDDDGKFKEGNEANRVLEDYDVLVGPFFICGISPTTSVTHSGASHFRLTASRKASCQGFLQLRARRSSLPLPSSL